MVKIHYLKVHGSKNDFILIDENDLSREFSYEEKQKLSQTLCDRELGIGADGLLIVNAEVNNASMRIFNADGSEASMCGNGLRCAGRYILEKQGMDYTVVNTLKANLHVSRFSENELKVPFIQVEISPVSFDPNSLPMNTAYPQVMNEKLPFLSEDLKFTAVAVPNPHLVAIVDKENMLNGEQRRIAEMLNSQNPYFPDGVNVSFVYPVGDGEIFVNTYERGVGFTNACGTAMSASSLVTVLNQLHDYGKPLTVFNNGGYVQTIVHNNNGKQWIDLIGNGTYSFEGEVSVNLDNLTVEDNIVIETFNEEESNYSLIEEQARDLIEKLFNREKV